MTPSLRNTRVWRQFATAGALGALALGTTAAGADAANHLIVPGVSIGGAKLGQSETAVRRELGRPTTSRQLPLRLCAAYREICIVWNYKPRGLQIEFFGPKTRLSADDIWTTRPTFSTAAGIHVGSTTAQLEQAYPAVQCDPNASFKWCTLGHQNPSRQVPLTEFYFPPTDSSSHQSQPGYESPTSKISEIDVLLG